jgi:hypothetical protein
VGGFGISGIEPSAYAIRAIVSYSLAHLATS